ncbi:MAG: ABC transporter permease [Elusimicrobia bacterium]|nr:ABC transporter permease [Elusimicrobiota bacterium]
MIPRLPLILCAFLRRDALQKLSYRTALVLDLAAILLSVATFYYVAKLIGPGALPAMAPYGGDYFAFVLLGIAFSSYQAVGLNSFSESLRQEQMLGTLESLLCAPVRLSALLLGFAQWDILYATLQTALYLLVGAAVFGVSFPSANLPAALLIFTLTLTACAGLGLFSAAFILMFKRGDPAAWLVASVSELLGGVYFPVAILPDWLRTLSLFIPMTHSLEGMRLALLKSASIREVAPQAAALAGFTAVFLPLGIVFFRKAFDKAKADGSLGHY